MSSEDAISILCTTWNVGNAEPKEEELQGWLPSEPSFDLVVVGTQVRVTSEAVVRIVTRITPATMPAACTLKITCPCQHAHPMQFLTSPVDFC